MDGDLAQRAMRARQQMQPPWNELREQRVLGRVAEARRRRVVMRRRAALAAGAAAAAAAVLVAVLWSAGGDEPAPVTRHGEPARLDLADGSVALLDADARVRVDRQGRDAVRLTQQEGTVTYDVAHDPSRPFVVHAAHVVVRVRGTRFVVAMEPGFVEVRVEEGRVEVEAHGRGSLLRPGEQLRVAAAPPQPSAAEGSPEESRVATADEATAEPAEEDAPEVTPREPPRAPRRRPRQPSVSPEPPPPEPTLQDRLAEADAARRRGRLDEAAAILHAAVEAHSDDAGLPGALFTLGRIERRRGQHAAAAEAFARAYRAAPSGPLAEDALAEEAVALHDAGMRVRALAAARRYLEAHPDGLHVARVRALLP